MTIPFDAKSGRVVFWASASSKQHLCNDLEKLGCCPTYLQSLSSLQALVHQPPMVLVVALDQSEGRPSEADECEALMRCLADLRNHRTSTYVIVLSSTHLCLETSCRMVLAGVNAIIDYQREDFVTRLAEHLQLGRHVHQEKSARHRDVNEAIEKNGGIVGHSATLRRVIEKARRAAMVSDAPVLIYGESGTGKQRLAELIHQHDEKRGKHPFVCVNCAAITGTLAESELFGHRKGAFTGATEDRPGYLRAAHQGTILLDEISELPLALQPKLLRFLQEGRVMPVGSDKEYPVDIRVVAATNRDLSQMVAEGTFRLDLYHRLNVIFLHVPPLRERIEDIPLLFAAFLQKYAHYYAAAEIKDVDPTVYEVLSRNLGNGNIRELENIVRQTLIFKECGQRIEVGDLPNQLLRNATASPSQPDPLQISETVVEQLAQGSKRLSDAVADYEKAMLTRLIERGGNRQNLADHLGITRRTLYNKLRQYQLD